ncbi:MAG TPA: zinc-binding dehydrogenase [Streptosporangiaceae bacterium]|jgi:NADPH2:quinone reductase|nr:zinc-binding dehydrogenase [Streptosporangiaceae bacterium]
MRAVVAGEFGGPEVLVPAEVAEPEPDRGQVLVSVAAADVLFLDARLRLQGGGAYFDVVPPYVPGGGVAGQVTGVGEGVASSWLGRRVAARTGVSGGYAELAVADVAQVVPIPEGLAIDQAAALIHDGLTAFSLIAAAPITAGSRVLVTAAAGGMGLLLVQLARQAGADVAGAARGGRKLEAVRKQGADVAVDYSAADWTDQLLAAWSGDRPEVVFDGAGGRIGLAAFEVTAPGGWFSAHGAPGEGFSFAPIDPQAARRRDVSLRGIRDVQVTPPEARRLLDRVLAAAVAGTLTPVIGQTFPLSSAAQAHAGLEDRSSLGKTLLLP